MTGTATRADGFDAALLTGLLAGGVPARFVRRLLATYSGPDEWRASVPLEDEDVSWRSLPPLDPGAETFVLGAPGYPWVLALLPSPPPVLYVAGDASLLAPAVCVTGTRHMTGLGRVVASVAAEEAVAVGAVVASGSDAGVDEHAMRTALDAGGRVLAVPGNGLDAGSERSESLHRDVLAGGGAVVSMFPPGTRESSYSLLGRTRLLAALAAPLVVAEAGVPSVSTSCARTAVEVGSPILVPFPRKRFHREPGARGVLALAGVTDVDALGWPPEMLSARTANGFANAVADDSDDLRLMLRVLWWFRPRGPEELLRRAPAG